MLNQQTVIHHTFTLERSYPHPPERVFAAFSDPATKRRWHFEGGNSEIEKFEMDFRVGGSERVLLRMGPDTPIAGMLITREAGYGDIVPNRRIVIASGMSLGDKRINLALETFEFLPAEKGTDLLFTHQCAFFEGADGPEMRRGGWVKLLDQLTAELT